VLDFASHKGKIIVPNQRGRAPARGARFFCEGEVHEDISGLARDRRELVFAGAGRCR
jgi:hypothetical protein